MRRPELIYDEAQERVSIILAELAAHLDSNFLLRLWQAPPQGIYLWGGVGRGKTVLMDSFYERCRLSLPQKKRIHFHRFMQEVHQSLHQHPNFKDPLKILVKKWAKHMKILCLDEFFVEDIVDAMILGKLLQYLFESGVVVVTTSNRHPRDLYPNGLQRDKFLPAIKLMEDNMKVVSIDHEDIDKNIDYRLRILTQVKLYHDMADSLEPYFADLALDFSPEKLIILDREIKTKRLASNIVWFDFKIICASPRSQLDYIEIARRFHTVFVSNVTIMTQANDNMARRFIALIDEFYDRNVKLVISAETDIAFLYQGELLSFEFERTISRLTEMQSQDYLSKPHLA